MDFEQLLDSSHVEAFCVKEIADHGLGEEKAALAHFKATGKILPDTPGGATSSAAQSSEA